MPRLCIKYLGIYLTTEENHGKPQSGQPKGAQLISTECDSFSRLGHRRRWPRLACCPVPPLAFASGDGVTDPPTTCCPLPIGPATSSKPRPLYKYHVRSSTILLHTLHPAFEDGTDRVFRNVGILQF